MIHSKRSILAAIVFVFFLASIYQVGAGTSDAPLFDIPTPITPSPGPTSTPTPTATPTSPPSTASPPPPTATPTATSATELKLGVNFWNEKTTQIFNPTPGPDGKRGYVLLINAWEDKDYNDLRPNIQVAVEANLIPIIRLDYKTGQKPETVPRTAADRAEWLEELTKLIDKYSTAGAELFVVGNEPGLEGDISAEIYAEAYVVLWESIHGEDGSERQNIKLLIAGQNFHTNDIVRWPGLVAEAIKETLIRKQVNNAESVYTNWIDGYAIHTYGYGNLPDQGFPWTYRLEEGVSAEAAELVCDDSSGCPTCPSPSDPSQPCDGLGVGWEGDDNFLNFVDQLESIPAGKPVYITEFNTFTGGDNCARNDNCDSPYVPSNNYRTDWIEDTLEVVGGYSQVKGLLWFAGDVNNDWQHFTLIDLDEPNRNYEPAGRLSQAKRDFCEAQGNFKCEKIVRAIDVQSGAIAEIEIDGITFPEGVYALMRADNLLGLEIWALSDASGQGGSSASLNAPRASGLAHPLLEEERLRLLRSFDLSDDRLELIRGLPSYTETTFLRVDDLPTEAVRWLFVLIDENGEEDTSVFEYIPDSSDPGGDNPDDNYSAATQGALNSNSGVQGRGTPRIAILNRGFSLQAMLLLSRLGEAATLVSPNFNPAIVADFPVLFIPSGSLVGLGNADFFRARLEAYAGAGGVVVALDQQRLDFFA